MTDFLLGIGLTVGFSVLAAVAMMAWAYRSKTPLREPVAAAPEPELLGQCRCEDCLVAVQPVQMVQVGHVTHLVQRDAIHHEYSNDCVCRPQPSLALGCPTLVHIPLQPGATT